MDNHAVSRVQVRRGYLGRSGSNRPLAKRLGVSSQVSGTRNIYAVRQSRSTSLCALFLIAVSLVSSWRGVYCFDQVSASVTDRLTDNVNNHDIYKKQWDPPLPVANYTYVVE